MSSSTLSHSSTTDGTHRRPHAAGEAICATETPGFRAAGASNRARTGAAARTRRARGAGHPGPRAGRAGRPGTEARRGITGLLVLGVVLVTAAVALGARTWHVGAGLGTALFPVDGIVELAAVGTGTVSAGWVGGHALVALGWVLACRKGVRWTAGERAVSRHAPAVVRRLARVAVGAGIGLALAAPTATALPERGAATDANGRPAVVVDLGWEPTGRSAGEIGADGHGRAGSHGGAGGHAFGPNVAAPAPGAEHGGTGGHAFGPGTAAPAPGARPTPERSALVNRGLRAGTGREPVVVVEPGDTLWAIAADRLATERATADPSDAEAPAAGPSDAEVAAAVERWHHVNRQTVGANPDLIRPGTVLHQP